MELEIALKLIRTGQVQQWREGVLSGTDAETSCCAPESVQKAIETLQEIEYLGNVTNEQMFNHLLVFSQRQNLQREPSAEYDFEVVFTQNASNALTRTTIPPNVALLKQLLDAGSAKKQTAPVYSHLEKELQDAARID